MVFSQGSYKRKLAGDIGDLTGCAFSRRFGDRPLCDLFVPAATLRAFRAMGYV